MQLERCDLEPRQRGHQRQPLLDAGRPPDLVRFIYEHGLDTGQRLHKVDGVARPQHEGGGGVAVAVHGARGDDGCAGEIGLGGHAGGGVENVVVRDAALGKAPFMDAAGDHGAIRHVHDGPVVRGVKRVDDADAPGAAGGHGRPGGRVRGSAPAHHHVAAQVDDKTADAMSDKEVGEIVGDVALGDAAQIEDGLGIGDGKGGLG